MKSQLITAKDLVAREGFPNVASRIRSLSLRQARKDASQVPWNGRLAAGEPVLARVDFGRWITDCECGGAEYVDPEEALFFCLSCGNAAAGGQARPVIFPTAKVREEIEQLLLERPVIEGAGLDAVERAFKARPSIPGLARSWNPEESVEELRVQNELAGIKPGHGN